MISLSWGNLKKKRESNTNKFIYETETDPKTQKTNLWLPTWGVEDKLGVGN